MSCCGSQRAAVRSNGVSTAASAPRYATWGPVDLEYSGHGELTVVGPLTGSVYRFTGNGARVRVHGSDAPSLVSVPGLKPVR